MLMRVIYSIGLTSLLTVMVLTFLTSNVIAHYVTGTSVVHITGEGFEPNNLKVKQGDLIMFENTDSVPHWPASDFHPDKDIYPEFDGKKPLEPMGTWIFKADKVGKWEFYDNLKLNSVGILVVEESGVEINSQLESASKFTFSTIHNFILKNYFNLFPSEKNRYLQSLTISSMVHSKDSKLKEAILLLGPEPIMEKLFTESKRDRSVNCHSYSHMVGRSAYELLNAQGLANNISLCGYGYTHGLVSGFIAENGIDHFTDNLSRMCENLKTKIARVQCYHGAGHGLMGYYDNDLPAAIKKCKEFRLLRQKHNCYIGSFMENVASGKDQAYNPHKTKWLSNEDPFFPCNAVDGDSNVQNACYILVPAWLSYVHKNDMDKIVEVCKKAKDYAESCFNGFGDRAVIYTNMDIEKTVDLCNKINSDSVFYGRCIESAQRLLMENIGPGFEEKTTKFCDLLSEAQRNECKRRLNDRINDLSRDGLTPDLMTY